MYKSVYQNKIPIYCVNLTNTNNFHLPIRVSVCALHESSAEPFSELSNVEFGCSEYGLAVAATLP